MKNKDFFKAHPGIIFKVRAVDVPIHSAWTMERLLETIHETQLDKQIVKKAIDKKISESIKHQLERMRFKGNGDNELVDDCKQIGKQQGLEELKCELGLE